ncbi:phosphatase PAP2 family protein [Aldersonia sp. NBC_00410]|uniref:phosphatase PAP2 family protein n=1 Tax=Aldersonia sp. NBC_00410 TaxID=2975954 RepID=UPI0022503CC7|nr:phosphatase PAP2 family protein [Aldersonia sp. NBC_00410]MCX5045717.1 phosphatase PAP2 family protein [Aldersonia sp. NBC_00410]
MSALMHSEHTLLTEITTEIATAEVAIWAIAVGSCAIVVGTVLAHSARSRQQPDRTVEARNAALQIGGMLTLFIALAVQVHLGGWLTSADMGVTNWFVAHRSPTLTSAARAVTDLGSPVVIAAIAIAAAVIIGYRHRSVLPAVTIVATVALAGAASSLTKIVVARARPPAELHLVTETDFSFPSGHVTGTVALLGVVLVVAPITHRWVGVVAATAAIAMWLLVATSRLYLGVHWLTDVLAGTVLAIAVVMVTTTALRLFGSPVPRNTDDPGHAEGATQPHAPVTMA